MWYKNWCILVKLFDLNYEVAAEYVLRPSPRLFQTWLMMRSKFDFIIRSQFEYHILQYFQLDSYCTGPAFLCLVIPMKNKAGCYLMNCHDALLLLAWGMFCWTIIASNPHYGRPQCNMLYWGSWCNFLTVCLGAVSCEWDKTYVYFGITHACFIRIMFHVFSVGTQYQHHFFIYVKNMKMSFGGQKQNLQIFPVGLKL